LEGWNDGMMGTNRKTWRQKTLPHKRGQPFLCYGLLITADPVYHRSVGINHFDDHCMAPMAWVEQERHGSVSANGRFNPVEAFPPSVSSIHIGLCDHFNGVAHAQLLCPVATIKFTFVNMPFGSVL